MGRAITASALVNPVSTPSSENRADETDKSSDRPEHRADARRPGLGGLKRHVPLGDPTGGQRHDAFQPAHAVQIVPGYQEWTARSPALHGRLEEPVGRAAPQDRFDLEGGDFNSALGRESGLAIRKRGKFPPGQDGVFHLPGQGFGHLGSELDLIHYWTGLSETPRTRLPRSGTTTS